MDMGGYVKMTVNFTNKTNIAVINVAQNGLKSKLQKTRNKQKHLLTALASWFSVKSSTNVVFATGSIGNASAVPIISRFTFCHFKYTLNCCDAECCNNLTTPMHIKNCTLQLAR